MTDDNRDTMEKVNKAFEMYFNQHATGTDVWIAMCRAKDVLPLLNNSLPDQYAKILRYLNELDKAHTMSKSDHSGTNHWNKVFDIIMQQLLRIIQTKPGTEVKGNLTATKGI